MTEGDRGATAVTLTVRAQRCWGGVRGHCSGPSGSLCPPNANRTPPGWAEGDPGHCQGPPCSRGALLLRTCSEQAQRAHLLSCLPASCPGPHPAPGRWCALEFAGTDSREELVLLFTRLPCTDVFKQGTPAGGVGHREADRVPRMAAHQRDPECGRDGLGDQTGLRVPRRVPSAELTLFLGTRTAKCGVDPVRASRRSTHGKANIGVDVNL